MLSADTWSRRILNELLSTYSALSQSHCSHNTCLKGFIRQPVQSFEVLKHPACEVVFNLSRGYFLEIAVSDNKKTRATWSYGFNLALQNNRTSIMCRSSQNIPSTVTESKRDYSAASSERGNVSTLDQQNIEPATASKGRPLQIENVKDISSKGTVSPRETSQALWPRRNVYHVKDQDISIALATFPEFFPEGLAIDQDMLAATGSQTLISNGRSVRKQNLQSECGGLVLWYIREYGL